MKKMLFLIFCMVLATAGYCADEKKPEANNYTKMLTYAQVDIWGNVEIYQMDGHMKYKAGSKELEQILSGAPASKQYVEDAKNSFIWGWVMHLISTGFFVTDFVWYVSDSNAALKQPWLFYGSLLGSATLGVAGSAWLLDGVNKYYLAINEYNKSLLSGSRSMAPDKEIWIAANLKF